MRFEAKSFLDDQDLGAIIALEGESNLREGITYKLELAYKKQLAALRDSSLSHKDRPSDEFLCWEGSRLVGYLGLLRNPGFSIEVNGLVAPSHRRRGIFTTLLRMALETCQDDPILLLCDATSVPGQGFVKSLPLSLHHSEYEMFLDKEAFLKGLAGSSPEKSALDRPSLVARPAQKADQAMIKAINAIAFDMAIDTMPDMDPDALRAEGMNILMFTLENQVIGKSHLQFLEGQGGIFGLALLPEYRGRGYGKDLLRQSVVGLLDLGAEEVFLQVTATNENALRLYLQSGFKVTSTMDYYQYLKEKP